jgi:serine/threonine protein kinase
MPAPTTDAELIDLIQKSNVVEAPSLTAYLQQLRDDSALPQEASVLAERMVQDGILTYFQAEQILLGKWKRFSIGKYKVLERIGAGGMGQVFLCEHKLMRRRVAVKVLPTAKAEEHDSLERFYREARAVAALDHPNLVRAFDIDQEEALHFLVLEYVDGASLQDIVRKSGPMDPNRACHYVYQSALGLQYAFEVAGLVHRDIKPSNILVDRSGLVKILDMGLARFFHDQQDMLTKKSDESVLGTADYLAPEQALDSHKVDIRGDIYSLGATFYFLLTGQPPFADGSVAQKLIWHQTRKPKPIRLARPDVSEAISAIQERMMAKDPGARFQTPKDLALALAPFIQTPIAPPAEAELPRLSRAAAAVGATSTAQVSSRIGLRLPVPGSGLPTGYTPVMRPTMTPPVPVAVRPTIPTSGGGVAKTAAAVREASSPGQRGDVQPQSAAATATASRTAHNPFVDIMGSGERAAAAFTKNQVYATAASRSSSLTLDPNATSPEPTHRGWLAAVLLLATLVGVSAFTYWQFFRPGS